MAENGAAPPRVVDPKQGVDPRQGVDPKQGVDPRRELGARGEQAAAEYLAAQCGLVILDRNWRCREGELDIVSTDAAGRIYICEVKTRSGTGFGVPAEAVTKGKRKRIRRLAQLWCAARLTGWCEIQFDVISVLWRPGSDSPQLTYLPEAF
ncbi:YraN family protein [Nakamurella aerolata]|uniref:UPF0102 protein HKD39_02370 n=1 Tax=Nakamurella aerolata TaxID=1656892 RepID=A0A849ACI3_9ACTN|nr:YraN family protein [Nakamurella aerolata]NNG34582.1 YraN family protein [Nakamurella aerolata]